MTKCDILGCEKEMDKFHPVKPRSDGIIIQVLDSGRAYLICSGCAKKLGLVKI